MLRRIGSLAAMSFVAGYGWTGIASAAPLLADGNFLNLPGTEAYRPGEALVQVGGVSFGVNGVGSFQQWMAGSHYTLSNSLGMDVAFLILPSTPPLEPGPRSTLNPTGSSVLGGTAGLRYRWEWENKQLPPITAGAEFEGPSDLGKKSFVWPWWAPSDSFSPFVSASKEFDLGGTRELPLTLSTQLGWGWGRFRGYGPITGNLYGVFFGGVAKYGPASFIVEMDGRDLNVGLRSTWSSFEVTLGVLQLEHFRPDRYGNNRPVHVGGSLAFRFGGQGAVIALAPPVRPRLKVEPTGLRLFWDLADPAQATGTNVYFARSRLGPWIKVNTNPLTRTNVLIQGAKNPYAVYFALTAVDSSGHESARLGPLWVHTTPGQEALALRPRLSTEPEGLRLLVDPPDPAAAAGTNVYFSNEKGGPYRKANEAPVTASSVLMRGAKDPYGVYFQLSIANKDGTESSHWGPLHARPPASAAPKPTPRAFVAKGIRTPGPVIAKAAPTPTRVAPLVAPTRAATTAAAVAAKPTTPPATAASTGSFGAPTGIKGKSVDGTVTLKWQPVSGATGYSVYMSNESGKGYTRVNATPLAKLNFEIQGLPSGIPFFFVVRAVNAAGAESPSSKEAAIVP